MLPLDKTTCSAAVSACGPAGKWQLALRFLDDCARRQIAADQVMYGSVITACAMGRQSKKSVQLVESMHTMAIRPNEICYTAARRV